MPLLSVRNLTFSFSGPPLFDGIDLEVEAGERIGLIGRNGSGKSTLMKIMLGEVAPDDGTVQLAAGKRIARLIQEVPTDSSGTVADIVRQGFLDQSVAADDDPPEEWQQEDALDRVLSMMSLEGAISFETLSSGMKRRALLARALITRPDMLLLDEPTNHLDIPAIAWLERFLRGYEGTLLFVTHDRAFLQALATRIVEIERGRLFDWSCDYATFLQRRQAALDAEEKQEAAFDRKLAEEEVWIRQGIKARRTRNEGRVRALKKMREERRQRRTRVGNVRMQAAEADRSGRLVIEASEVSFAYETTPIVSRFSTLITRGDKIGVIGPNGAGKTTLLRILLGDLPPDSGTVRHGTRLEVIYFDQLREQIDESKTVVENVGEGQEMLSIGGAKKHIYGYLQDFLFTPERARRPARYLSGGERNRMLLARLFKRPSNVMVLDEPTNDLDSETLELLEELLADYSGTLLLVSHDRAFLNNVVTSTFAFEPDGTVHEYDGGYDDYVRQHSESQEGEPQTEAAAEPARRKSSAGTDSKRLSYHERRELEELPDRIDVIEQEQRALHVAMADPEFFKQDRSEIAEATERLNVLDTELQELMHRWEELAERE